MRGTVAAIECFVGSTLVDRVGVGRGRVAGDVSWDGPGGSEDNYWHVEYAETVWSASRYGCFVNERGYADFRATCDTVYVGVGGGQDGPDLDLGPGDVY